MEAGRGLLTGARSLPHGVLPRLFSPGQAIRLWNIGGCEVGLADQRVGGQVRGERPGRKEGGNEDKRRCHAAPGSKKP